MAELGFTYEQILNHYYEGTKLKKLRYCLNGKEIFLLNE